MWNYIYPNELYHHGVKGQKWGVRRYQNKDGSLTNKGKKRYLDKVSDSVNKKIEQRKADMRIDRAKKIAPPISTILENKRARDLERQKVSEIKQSKGVIKGAKTVAYFLNALTSGRPSRKTPTPWDEKHRGRQGGYI